MHDALRENGVGGPETWEALKSRFLELVDDGDGAEESGLVRELLIADREAGKFLGAMDDEPGEAPVFEATLAAGEEFAACRVVRLAGRGGMGEVYEAEDLGVDVGRDAPEGAPGPGSAGRRVALKLLPGSAADRRRHAALRRDAAALARLTHPGIARVYRAGFASLPGSAEAPRPYMVMEFIDGEPVEAYVERMARAGGRRPALALEIGLALCDAMAYSHRQGVVHRDLKSSNVLVRADGTLSVVDFGIARLSESGDASGRSTATMDLAGVGSLTSISPERARGVDSSAREDVWAIGALLYAIAMGRPARELADAPVFEALQVIGREPPARADGGAIGRDLATVIDRCMAFDPVDRYGDAGEALAELKRVRDGLAPRARAIGPAGRTWRWAKRHRAAAWGLSAVMVVLLVSSAALAVFAANAASARRLAEDRRTASEAVANGLLFEVSEALVGVPGASAAQERLLEIGLEYAEAAMSREGELDGASRLSLARALMALGHARHVRGVAGEGAANAAEAFRRAREMALEVAGERAEGSKEQAEALGLAAYALRFEAPISAFAKGQIEYTFVEREGLALAERVLAIDPDQREAGLAASRLGAGMATDARRRGDWLESVEACERAVERSEHLLVRYPTDREVIANYSLSMHALVQHLLWAREAGEDVSALAVAERSVDAADRAAALDRTGLSRVRVWTSRQQLARAILLEAPERAAEGLQLLRDAMAGIEATASADPEEALVGRDLWASHIIAANVLERHARTLELGPRRAALLAEVVAHLERVEDLYGQRLARGEAQAVEADEMAVVRSRLAALRAEVGAAR